MDSKFSGAFRVKCSVLVRFLDNGDALIRKALNNLQLKKIILAVSVTVNH
jgi:hypothetical protein